VPYPSYQPSSSRLIGIGFIVLLHVALIYALVHALARRSIEVTHAPIETKIITEAPPAPVEAPPPPPKFAPPPPPFVPPPEVNVATPPPLTSTAPTAITTVKPAPAPTAPVTVMPRLDGSHSHQPEYPAQSRQLGEQGSVILQVLVDLDGSVVDSKLVQSSGSQRLDEAALSGVKTNYRFFPGTIDGKPQQMWFTIKFNWKLQ
jgi:periplasmic protein TonB